MIKTFLKRLLRHRGLALKRISLLEQKLLDIIDAKGNLKFVQIGANDGLSFDDIYYFVTKHNCAGLVIEPITELATILKHNYRAFPKIVAVNCAVHPTLREISLYRVRSEALDNSPAWASGVVSIDKNWLEQAGLSADSIEAVNVPAFPLMHLLKHYSFEQIDFLQTDTEGFDLEVLKMVDFNLTHPIVIKSEAIPGRGNAIEEFLTDLDYRCIRDGNDIIGFREF
jgi:FkbM family methyltransferase